MRLHRAKTKSVDELPMCCPEQQIMSTPTELIEVVIDLDSMDKVKRGCCFCGAPWGTLVRYLVVKDLSGRGFEGQRAFADGLDIAEGPFDPNHEPGRVDV